MAKEKESFFSQRNMTTAGFLGLIFGGVYLLPKIPGSVLSGALGSYGTGVAFATAFYRFRELMKDGTVAKNEFGDGAFAALGVLASIAAVNAIPYLRDSMVKELENDSYILMIGVAGVVAGFFQARANMRDVINKEPANEK